MWSLLRSQARIARNHSVVMVLGWGGARSCITLNIAHRWTKTSGCSKTDSAIWVERGRCPPPHQIQGMNRRRTRFR
jgi:hypothetical protein